MNTTKVGYQVALCMYFLTLPGSKIVENMLFGAAFARKVFLPYSSGTQGSRCYKVVLAVLCWNKVKPLPESVLAIPRRNTVFQKSTARTLYQFIYSCYGILSNISGGTLFYAL